MIHCFAFLPLSELCGATAKEFVERLREKSDGRSGEKLKLDFGGRGEVRVTNEIVLTHQRRLSTRTLMPSY